MRSLFDWVGWDSFVQRGSTPWQHPLSKAIWPRILLQMMRRSSSAFTAKSGAHRSSIRGGWLTWPRCRIEPAPIDSSFFPILVQHRLPDLSKGFNHFKLLNLLAKVHTEIIRICMYIYNIYIYIWNLVRTINDWTTKISNDVDLCWSQEMPGESLHGFNLYWAYVELARWAQDPAELRGPRGHPGGKG